MPTSEVNRRPMGVSLLPSRTLWSTQVDIYFGRGEARAATLLPDILPYDSSRPASFPDNGRHSPTMPSIFSCAFSRMARSTGTT